MDYHLLFVPLKLRFVVKIKLGKFSDKSTCSSIYVEVGKKTC
jgi:hypothetical protein